MPIQVQAHRGARAAKPENTLPAFELALDLGVHSIETDLHLTHDGVVVVYHDDAIHPRLCRSTSPLSLPQGPAGRIANLMFSDLNAVTVDVPLLSLPRKSLPPTPAARLLMERRGRPLYAIPTLEDLLGFLKAYSSDLGQEAGKSPEQQDSARRVRLDLELKGLSTNVAEELAGRLERQVIRDVQRFDLLPRVCLRSFDHRRLLLVKEIEPAVRTGVLLAAARPVDVAHLVQSAKADELYPEQQLVDESLVREMKEQGVPIFPWTVNDADAWERLIDWGVDGITTDYPGELLHWIKGQKPS